MQNVSKKEILTEKLVGQTFPRHCAVLRNFWEKYLYNFDNSWRVNPPGVYWIGNMEVDEQS